MTYYKLQKNVPLPGTRTKRDYPIKSMQVGDSFLAPINERATVASYVNIIKKKTGQEYTCRKTNYRGQDVIRVWRVA